MANRWVLVVCAVLLMVGSVTPSVMGAQSERMDEIDLPAIALSPLDPELEDYLHVGAFFESLDGEAAVIANYRGRGLEEATVAEMLARLGWVEKYVATLNLPHPANEALLQRQVRSYVTRFASAEQAQEAFVYLEDERDVLTAEDRSLSRAFGEQSELTHDRASNRNGPFQSLDLTLRVGNLIAGVTLIVYPTSEGMEPDQEVVEQLATILEERMTSFGGAEGLSRKVVRFSDERPVVTLDDAYYRRGGQDVPMADEQGAATEARVTSYREAESVYQLFQTVTGQRGGQVLMSVTLYQFREPNEARQWADDVETILAANPYYGNLQRLDIGGESWPGSVFTFDPNGTGEDPQVAKMVVIVEETLVARIQLVPLGLLPPVPEQVMQQLAEAQANCLGQQGCSGGTMPQSLVLYVDQAGLATPVPSASPKIDEA
jgi:hypothetical protein